MTNIFVIWSSVIYIFLNSNFKLNSVRNEEIVKHNYTFYSCDQLINQVIWT